MREFFVRVLSVALEPSAATRRQRRILATVILVIVVAMVLVGSFLLQAGVSPGTSLVFWGICFLLMFWAVFLAYIDVKSIKREFRTQRKELLRSAFSRRPLKKEERVEEDGLPSTEGNGQSEASRPLERD